MNWPEVIRDVNKRIAELKRLSVRYRQGEITDLDPLSVDLGGSGVPHTNVKTLPAGELEVGDIVAVLTFGNDLLVLGKITAGPASASGSTTITGNGTAERTITVAHGLPSAPSRAFVNVGHQHINANVTAKDATNLTIVAAHVHNTNWSGTYDLDWVALR